MICRKCKAEIENDSNFCRFCGEQVVKPRKKDEIKVPVPRQLKSGSWNIELKGEGEGFSVTAPTREAVIVKAKAIRMGLAQQEKKHQKRTGICVLPVL